MLMLFTPSVISSIGIRRGKEDQNPNPNYQAKRDEGRTRKLGERERSQIAGSFYSSLNLPGLLQAVSTNRRTRFTDPTPAVKVRLWLDCVTSTIRAIGAAVYGGPPIRVLGSAGISEGLLLTITGSAFFFFVIYVIEDFARKKKIQPSVCLFLLEYI